MQIRFFTMKLDYKGIIWLIKWASSLVVIAGIAATSANLYPYNMYLHLVGIVGWFVVSLAWHDRSLITLNTVAAFIYLNGIIGSFL